MIYVITHKVFDNAIINNGQYDDYRILHVGTNENFNSSYLRDDVGDNISFKNASYCELTGMYWVWKNRTSKSDPIVGISHYRRYFCTSKQIKKYINKNILPSPLTREQYEELLYEYDIIVPKPKSSIRHNVYQLYGLFHNSEDLDAVRLIIERLTPEYSASFDQEMNSHKLLFANMLITKKELYDNYCEWLFLILKELEKKVQNKNTLTTSKEEKYQARIFGFISERLLQVWIRQNRLKVRYVPVFNTEIREKSLLSDLMYSRFKPFLLEFLFHKNPKDEIRKRIEKM